VNSILTKTQPETRNQVISKSGYTFNPDNKYWKLDKDTKVAVGKVTRLLNAELIEGYLKTLIYYAHNLSSANSKLMNDCVFRYICETKSSIFNEIELINYKSQLTSETEHYLARLRTFLRKWYALGYEGVSDDVMHLLDGWTLKGAIKGDIIKRLDPIKGPFSDIELQAFNEKTIQAYENDKISLLHLSLGLLFSNTGRRPIQISHLRIKDILKGSNKKGDPIYLINIPRGKQRAALFREQFKQFAVTHELWVILNAQAISVSKLIRETLGLEIHEKNNLELPLFPNMTEVSKITTLGVLFESLKNDTLHITLRQIRGAIKKIGQVTNIYSERTGERLNISPYRFRYTTGTRAAREGFGEMVIAELLDHSDNQNAGVYIENIPEHVESLDNAVGHQLAHFAQAFAGVLVDSESNALRGDDLNSRIKTDGEGIGTCGSFGFCGANVPIPCYTCMHFQPWVDGPHEIIYDELIAERKRIFDITGDAQVSAVNDRTILAVADVIERCGTRKAGIKYD
jgi:integrase